ncbi:MAG: hypothetical protein WD036_08985 [Bauldia sp.]
MAEREKEYLFDDPRNVRRVIYGLYAACAVALGAELIVARHAEHPWEGLFGFYAVYGFIACLLLVLAAREMRKLLMRGEDYYDD